jgi:hypothetical protein
VGDNWTRQSQNRCRSPHLRRLHDVTSRTRSTEVNTAGLEPAVASMSQFNASDIDVAFIQCAVK